MFSPSSCSVFACVFLSLSSVFSPSSCAVCRYCRDWLLGRLGLRFVGQVGDFPLLCLCLLWSPVAEFWICYCWNLTSFKIEMTTFWKETRIVATFGSLVYDIFGALRSKIKDVPLHPKCSPAVYGKNWGVAPQFSMFHLCHFFCIVFWKITQRNPPSHKKGG